MGDIFTSEYKKGKYDVTTLDKKQLNALIKEDLLLFLVERWNAIEESKHITDFIYITQNITIGETVCLKVYEKIYSIFGDLRGTTKDSILSRIAVVISITENLHINKRHETVLKLYELITGQRTIANTNNSYYRQPDKQVRLLEECVNVDEINVLARFIATAYKVTQGRINGADELEILRAKDETVTLSNILWLKNTCGYPLYRLASHLINYSQYDNDELMNIYQAHFLEQYNDAPILKEEELNTKLDDMLQFAISNKDDKMFNWLSNVSSKSNRIKTILIPIISARPIGEIQSLPTELMDLAIDSVNQDNIDSYKQYTDFLRCLAAKGSIQQKQSLVTLIVRMLDEKKEDIQKIVSIIMSYKQLDKNQCDRIVSTLKCIVDGDDNDLSIQLCNEAIEHLYSLNKTSKRKRKSA